MKLEHLFAAKPGHFQLESGHHGTLWLELDTLFVRQTAIREHVDQLAERLAPHGIEAVCGPLTGGAFLAQLLAGRLEADFMYSERVDSMTAASDAGPEDLYPAQYVVPAGLRRAVSGRRIAVVDDVINAGSSVRATIADLRAHHATVVTIGALLVLGSPAKTLAGDLGVPLESLARWENDLYPPDDCPLCRAGEPLTAMLARGHRGSTHPRRG